MMKNGEMDHSKMNHSMMKGGKMDHSKMMNMDGMMDMEEYVSWDASSRRRKPR